MRVTLRWALGATLTLTALAYWLPPKVGTLVPAVPRLEGTGATQANAPLRADGAPHLPSVLIPVALEPASRDPFARWHAPPPLALTAVSEKRSALVLPAAPTPSPAQPPPAAPSQGSRYLGSMTTPAGERIVLLSEGDAALAVEVGSRLASGYVVQAIGADAVRLIYPPTGALVNLSIAAPAQP